MSYLKIGDRMIGMPERGGKLFLDGSDLSTITEEQQEKQTGLLLFRAQSGLCGLIPYGVRVKRAEWYAVGIMMLHHGDQLRINGHPAVFNEIVRNSPHDEPALTARLCPMCHDALESSAEVLRCPLCGEGYHEDCWTEVGKQHCFSRDCFFIPIASDHWSLS